MQINTKFAPGDVVRQKGKTCLIDYIVKDVFIRISKDKKLVQYRAESEDRKCYFWQEKEDKLTLVRKSADSGIENTKAGEKGE